MNFLYGPACPIGSFSSFKFLFTACCDLYTHVSAFCKGWTKAWTHTSGSQIRNLEDYIYHQASNLSILQSCKLRNLVKEKEKNTLWSAECKKEKKIIKKPRPMDSHNNLLKGIKLSANAMSVSYPLCCIQIYPQWDHPKWDSLK